MSGRTRVLAALAALLLTGAASALAQRPARAPATSAVSGRVVLAASGEAVPFSVVALLPVAGADTALTALTDGNGAFHFDSVRAGEYRPRLDRVGYEPEPQPAVRVGAARSAPLLIRSAPRALPPMAALPADSICHDAEQAEHEPAIARLWQQVQTAAQARRLFDLTYSYTVKTRGFNWQATSSARLRSPEQTEDVRHTPQDAFQLELSVSSPYAVWGTLGPNGFRLIVPDLPQLLSPGFLQTHCIMAVGDSAVGRGLRFLPNSRIPGYVQVRVAATVLLDPSYAVQRMNLEYWGNGRPFVSGGQSFADVGFPGGQLRFIRRLDLEEIPALSGTARWVGRTRYDNYRMLPDAAR
ncbi:MAG TPA: carboxypeptidase-like regulatory domain-containing protein [Longimicrobiales bacterium]